MTEVGDGDVAGVVGAAVGFEADELDGGADVAAEKAMDVVTELDGSIDLAAVLAVLVSGKTDESGEMVGDSWLGVGAELLEVEANTDAGMSAEDGSTDAVGNRPAVFVPDTNLEMEVMTEEWRTGGELCMAA